MTDDRDPFLAAELGSLIPPEHGPRFWDDLDQGLTTGSSPSGKPDRRWWAPSRSLLAAAAAVLIVSAAGLGLMIANQDNDTAIDTGPADPDGSDDSDGSSPVAADADGAPTSPADTDRPDGTGTSTTEPPTPSTTADDEPLDLTNGVLLDTSLDGSRQLYALVDRDRLGCEEQATWQLYWIAADGTGSLATDEIWIHPPAMDRGPGGRVLLLDNCETSYFLHVTTESPSGSFGPLQRVRPIGWENSTIQEASWGTEPGVLVLQVTEFVGGELQSYELQIDADTGTVLTETPVGQDEPGEQGCSAQTLTNPTINSGQPWSALAAEIQQAALDCDYDRLAELAAPDFTYSFGGGSDFAGSLRDAEAGGDDPTRKLVLLLGANPEQTGNVPQPSDPGYVIWPAFFACETDCGMDEAEVRRLGYTDSDIEGFREFGGYLGYRVGFAVYDTASEYSWVYFVAGD